MGGMGAGGGGSRKSGILIRAKVDFMFNRRGGEENFWALQERSIGYSGILKNHGGQEQGGGPSWPPKAAKKIINGCVALGCW